MRSKGERQDERRGRGEVGGKMKIPGHGPLVYVQMRRDIRGGTFVRLDQSSNALCHPLSCYRIS